MKTAGKFLLILILAVPFIGCSDDDVAVTGIELNETSLTLEVDKTFTLVGKVVPENADRKSTRLNSSH